jgi:hypothetical protein
MNAVSEQQAPTVTRALYAPIERKKKARVKKWQEKPAAITTN